VVAPSGAIAIRGKPRLPDSRSTAGVFHVVAEAAGTPPTKATAATTNGASNLVRQREATNLPTDA
jgi:hypothetical protein